MNLEAVGPRTESVSASPSPSIRVGRRLLTLAVAVAASCLFATGCDVRSSSALSATALQLTWTDDRGREADVYGLDVELRVERDDRWQTVATGGAMPDGTSAFSGVPDGLVEVRWSDSRGSWAPGAATVESPGTHALQLKRGVSVRLNVERDSGEPIERASATVWPIAGDPRTVELAAGTTVLPVVPAGPLKLVVWAPGHRCRVVDLRVRAPSKPDGVVELPTIALRSGGAALEVGFAGEGFTGVEAESETLEPWLYFAGAGLPARPLGEGQYRFDGLPPDGIRSDVLDARLVVRRGGETLLTRAVTVGPGGLDLGVIQLAR